MRTLLLTLTLVCLPKLTAAPKPEAKSPASAQKALIFELDFTPVDGSDMAFTVQIRLTATDGSVSPLEYECGAGFTGENVRDLVLASLRESTAIVKPVGTSKLRFEGYTEKDKLTRFRAVQVTLKGLPKERQAKITELKPD